MVALPVHDSLIVTVGNRQVATEAMRASCEGTYGRSPRIIEKVG